MSPPLRSRLTGHAKLLRIEICDSITRSVILVHNVTLPHPLPLSEF